MKLKLIHYGTEDRPQNLMVYLIRFKKLQKQFTLMKVKNKSVKRRQLLKCFWLKGALTHFKLMFTMKWLKQFVQLLRN